MLATMHRPKISILATTVLRELPVLRWEGRDDFRDFVLEPQPAEAWEVQERIELEVERSWLDGTGTPFRGDRSMYSEKMEFFLLTPKSDLALDIVGRRLSAFGVQGVQ
ncbi:hypothetical protein PC119_g24835 [Phytophthora cactorum]|nr:hypothetical protein PC114_g20101 [Phytophthora cactorum]KAG2966076.1 hypothetical protein PC119_g24835 [Phytophthora cactorum]